MCQIDKRYAASDKRKDTKIRSELQFRFFLQIQHGNPFEYFQVYSPLDRFLRVDDNVRKRMDARDIALFADYDVIHRPQALT